MKTTILGLLAETSIHSGAGRSSGIVDLPVAREAATDYPFIPGSSLKGALRDRATGTKNKEFADSIFGRPDNSGTLLVSDARLLLLPVRSLEGAYRWVTCPLVLERFRRDLARSGSPVDVPIAPPAAKREGQGATALGKAMSGKLHLEEREFTITDDCDPKVHKAIGQLIRHDETRARLAEQLVVVDDDAFAWFCRYAVPVQTRNQLHEVTKTSKNLWYEESLPPDTLLYALVMDRTAAETDPVEQLFQHDPYIQVGGNETVGQGWAAVSLLHGGPS